MEPISMGAVGLTAASQLLTQLMAQQAAKEAQAQAYKIAKEQEAKQRLAQAQRDQLSQINSMGQGEQNALGNLMAALQRTAR